MTGTGYILSGENGRICAYGCGAYRYRRPAPAEAAAGDAGYGRHGEEGKNTESRGKREEAYAVYGKNGLTAVPYRPRFSAGA